PLTIRWKLIDTPAAIIDRDRFHPLRRELSEIIGGHSAAKLVGCGENGFGNCPAIEGVRALLRDQVQRSSVVGIAEDLSQSGSAAIGQEYTLAFGSKGGIFPIIVDDLRDGVSVLCVVNGGLEEFVPRQFAEFFMHCCPACDRAGHSDGINAV